ncbi:hypothetical protein QW131_14705 [Roseibium salinum]|nr:hypothetical protein [Roseibium salinum]
MFGEIREEGFPSCSFWTDSFEGSDVHLAVREHDPCPHFQRPAWKASRIVNVAYSLLDMISMGRHEDGLPYTMSWVRKTKQKNVLGMCAPLST